MRLMADRKKSNIMAVQSFKTAQVAGHMLRLLSTTISRNARDASPILSEIFTTARRLSSLSDGLNRAFLRGIDHTTNLHTLLAHVWKKRACSMATVPTCSLTRGEDLSIRITPQRICTPPSLKLELTCTLQHEARPCHPLKNSTVMATIVLNIANTPLKQMSLSIQPTDRHTRIKLLQNSDPMIDTHHLPGEHRKVLATAIILVDRAILRHILLNIVKSQCSSISETLSAALLSVFHSIFIVPFKHFLQFSLPATQ